MNIENAKKISELLITPHSPDQLNRELSPQGLYEIIKDFFTFGGVRREKSKYYKEFYDELTKIIVASSTRESNDILNNFIVFVDKFTLYFEKKHEIDNYASSEEDIMMIKIASPGMQTPLELEIDTLTFKKSCTVLLIRETTENNIHRYEDLLTEDGRMNFRDHVFSNILPMKIDHVNSCFDNTLLTWNQIHNLAFDD